MTAEEIKAIRARAGQAFCAVVELAKDPANFRMSIPAREDDTDRLLVKVAEDAARLCDELERTRGEATQAIDDMGEEQALACWQAAQTVAMREERDGARRALAKLVGTLEPAIDYRGVQITLGQQDVNAIRGAVAEARALLKPEEAEL